MSDIEHAMKRAEAEGNLMQAQHVMKQLRDFLAGALCAACGEPLGHDDEIVQDDSDRTMHKRCEDAEQQQHPR